MEDIKMKNINMLQIKSEMLTFDTVHQCFIPISKRIVEQTDIIPLEMMPELTEQGREEYERYPLKFSTKGYEFTTVYEGKDNPNVNITLTYYLKQKELKDVLSDDGVLDIYEVIKYLDKDAYKYICNIMQKEESVEIFVNKIYEDSSNFVVYFDEVPVEDVLEEPCKYIACRNGKFEVLEF